LVLPGLTASWLQRGAGWGHPAYTRRLGGARVSFLVLAEPRPGIGFTWFYPWTVAGRVGGRPGLAGATFRSAGCRAAAGAAGAGAVGTVAAAAA